MTFQVCFYAFQTICPAASLNFEVKAPGSTNLVLPSHYSD